MTKPISIVDSYKPFSHGFGSLCLIPGTFIAIETFPCLIRLWDLSLPNRQWLGEINLSVQGPIDQFTVEQDLKKNILKVWGRSELGFLRYVFQKQEGGFSVFFEKTPQKWNYIVNTSLNWIKKEKQLLFSYGLSLNTQKKELELLSLGSNKLLDWDKVCRRLNLTEILPSLFLLSQSYSSLYQDTSYGLLKGCKEAFTKDKRDLVPLLLKIFQVNFEGLLVPQWKDTKYQGIMSVDEKEPDLTPLVILAELYSLIRKLFFEQKDIHFHILPHLPPEFFAGRMVNVNCQGLGYLSIEWTKKKLRRIAFYSNYEGDIHFHFPPYVKNFRFRDSLKSEGKEIEPQQAIAIEKNKNYFLDRFQK